MCGDVARPGAATTVRQGLEHWLKGFVVRVERAVDYPGEHTMHAPSSRKVHTRLVSTETVEFRLLRARKEGKGAILTHRRLRAHMGNHHVTGLGSGLGLGLGLG